MEYAPIFFFEVSELELMAVVNDVTDDQERQLKVLLRSEWLKLKLVHSSVVKIETARLLRIKAETDSRSKNNVSHLSGPRNRLTFNVSRVVTLGIFFFGFRSDTEKDGAHPSATVIEEKNRLHRETRLENTKAKPAQIVDAESIINAYYLAMKSGKYSSPKSRSAANNAKRLNLLIR
ncbi:hypothetical protein EVAR_3288_1 [Eumeta japonica]|uniref:Uncharacterized protein n=1 Tax=Eumeta variegata TaxID=151549 RepID=A0A4C1SVU9_EUMVA|nr:hypothetical protein EVAR_3288_1 [Eumeta japonica]